MRILAVLDPGHGGNAPIGRSSPIGVTGRDGLLEKNVTLAVAAQAARRLGGAVQLTRTADINLSLGDRARTAQRLGARAFVSVHANGGGERGGGGGEVWVHPAANAASLGLAEELRAPIVHRGAMAVLEPSLHAPDTAACLLELDYLDHEGGSRRLGDPAGMAAAGDALAAAMDRWLTHGPSPAPRAYSFGRRTARALAVPALDLTDFSESGFAVIAADHADRVPAEITRDELDALESAWDRMMRGVGMELQGAEADRRTFRGLLLGALVYSPFIRTLFQEITGDDTRRVIVHVGRNLPGILVDAFQWPSPGHHTVDVADLEQLPNVSGDPRNYMQLRYQVLVHVLRELRQGALGNGYTPAHHRAIDDENDYRVEQGQIGVKDYTQPFVDAAGTLRTELTYNGSVALWEQWHLTPDTNGIVSVDYSPWP